MSNLIGTSVIVRSNIAGVHAGTVESVDFATQTITLTKARRLWRIFTRDKTGSISDVAANGLAPKKEHQLGDGPEVDSKRHLANLRSWPRDSEESDDRVPKSSAARGRNGNRRRKRVTDGEGNRGAARDAVCQKCQRN